MCERCLRAAEDGGGSGAGGVRAFAADDFNVQFKEQVDYFRRKASLTAGEFDALARGSHDRAFTIAGAHSKAMVEDLRRAVDREVAGPIDPRRFKREFDAIAAKHGWVVGDGSKKAKAWRARVILDTNLRTSYMAGRRRQMIEGAKRGLRTLWQYRHAELREPLRPRKLHKSWDGLVLPWDDPWWKTHFPPNGFFCTCGVRPLSKREAEAEQAKRGKSGVDPSPPLDLRSVYDPRTKSNVLVPNGIDPGWDHAPGEDGDEVA